MANANTISQQIFDSLVSRDLEPEALDSQGKPAESTDNADMFSFEYKTENKNYGTAVILLDSDKNLEVYFGDNLGQTMDSDDKEGWYDFLQLIRNIAKRNLCTFSLKNLNRLKYSMQSMASMNESKLLEGYYGTKKTSYSDQPMETKLVIKHSKKIGEGDQRFRNIESLFVETAEGERFKLPFKNITGGKAMARHIAEGGKPYDAFGEHISSIVNEIATLQRFTRATRNKSLGEDAGSIAELAVKHYQDLKRKAKRMISRKGYKEEIENFDPMAITETEQTVDAVRDIFIQQSLDERIEEALPILAKIQETETMKELAEFEQWADSVIEGTGAVANTPEDLADLSQLMSEELPVGADASNALSALGSLLGDDDQLFDDLQELAQENPDADARPVIQSAMERLGVSLGEAAQSPYAIGMAQAMKSTGDKPPLKKSTITKAHEIARAIEKDEAKEDVNEAKEGYCSDKCCGSEVKAEDCTCPPDCPHCDCNAVEETTDIDTGKKVLQAQKDPMLEDELQRLIKLLK